MNPRRFFTSLVLVALVAAILVPSPALAGTSKRSRTAVPVTTEAAPVLIPLALPSLGLVIFLQVYSSATGVSLTDPVGSSPNWPIQNPSQPGFTLPG